MSRVSGRSWSCLKGFEEQIGFSKVLTIIFVMRFAFYNFLNFYHRTFHRFNLKFSLRHLTVTFLKILSMDSASF